MQTGNWYVDLNLEASSWRPKLHGDKQADFVSWIQYHKHYRKYCLDHRHHWIRNWPEFCRPPDFNTRHVSISKDAVIHISANWLQSNFPLHLQPDLSPSPFSPFVREALLGEGEGEGVLTPAPSLAQIYQVLKALGNSLCTAHWMIHACIFERTN